MHHVDVAIIGAGFTGAALAVNLLRRLPPGARIALIGAGDDAGRGVAYGTPDPDHRLNVPAGRMSLFATDPSDFVRWLGDQPEGQGIAADALPYSFAPRRAYGRYVADRLAAAEREATGRVSLLRLPRAALAARPVAAGLRIDLDGGGPVVAEATALCLGNIPTGLPVPADAVDRAIRDRIILDPWQPSALDAVGEDDDVLVIGTGLTMIDQVLSLTARGHRGRIVAMSRRGLLPLAHREPRQPPLALATVAATTPLVELSRLLRTKAKAEIAAGRDWRPVVDGLRPRLQEIWQGLGSEERERFLRHVGPFWNIHRHRFAPEVAARVADWRASGRLEVVRGRVSALDRDEADDRVVVALRPRGEAASVEIRVDRVLNCAGLDRGAPLRSQPLLRELADAGLLRADPAGLGLDIDAEGRVLDCYGRADNALFALGPLGTGRLWEIVAVPEIREQCADVAARIAADAFARHYRQTKVAGGR
jgi:uncharacterized NAD(P)/FAD-binding protein YdhS